MIRFLALVVVSMIVGGAYDIAAVVSTLSGHPWDPLDATPAPQRRTIAAADPMAEYRVFTRAKALAMLRYAAPTYGLQIEDVTAIHAGPREGSDRIEIAEFRYRFKQCERSGQAHFIGGEDIEFWWRLRDVGELQKFGTCDKG